MKNHRVMTMNIYVGDRERTGRKKATVNRAHDKDMALNHGHASAFKPRQSGGVIIMQIYRPALCGRLLSRAALSPGN